MLGGVAGLVAAILGAGAWALVVQQLTMSLVSTVLLWRAASWRPKLRFSRTSLHSLGGFGANVWGARLLGFAGGNADNIIVGRVLGESALGLYSVGFNLITLPLVRLVVPIQDTLFPAFSRLQDDRQRLASLWLRAHTSLIALIAPAVVGIALTAPDLVTVVLGNQWHGVAIILQILCGYAFVACLGALSQTVLIARGQARTVFRFSVFVTFSNIAAFLIGTHWGVVGVATAWTIVAVPSQLTLLALVSRSLGITLFTMFARGKRRVRGHSRDEGGSARDECSVRELDRQPRAEAGHPDRHGCRRLHPRLLLACPGDQA